MKLPLLRLVMAAGVTGSLLVAQAPVAAGPGDLKKKDLRETECRDIVAGTARYTRDRLVDGLPFSDAEYPDQLKGDSGTAVLGLELAAPSCSDVTYTLIVYGGDQQELARTSVVGNGTAGSEADLLDLTVPVDGYADDCLMLVATTSVQGIDVDIAPDVVEDYRSVCDRDAPGLTYR